MRFQASSTKKRYEELQKNPLFFAMYVVDSFFDSYAKNYVTIASWKPCDTTITISNTDDAPQRNDGERYVFIVEDAIESFPNEIDVKEDDDTIFFQTVIFDENNPKHWLHIFNDCSYNYRAGNIRHGYMSLIWALYTRPLNLSILNEAYKTCNKDVQQIVAQAINNNIYIFSCIKQTVLIGLICNTIPDASSKIIVDVENMLKELSSSINYNKMGVYEKVDFIINYGSSKEEKETLAKLFTTSGNKFIHYKYWKQTIGHKLYDYRILLDIFSYVDANEQMLIIKRYLHDIRNCVTVINDDILNGFRDYKYPACVDGRYFIYRPGANMLLAAPMFSDAIMTLKKTKGEKIQTFNGILDLAIKHANSSYPSIDLGVREFLPICDGGLMPNNSFVGFIHYNIIKEFDETLLTEKKLIETAKLILQKYAVRQYYYICTNDSGKELSEDLLRKCTFLNRKKKISCGFMQLRYYTPDRWKRKNKEGDKMLSLCIERCQNLEGMFTFDVVSLPRLKTCIKMWASKWEKITCINGILPDELQKDEFAQLFVKSYYKDSKIDLYPNKSLCYSTKKSLLKLWSDDSFPANASLNDKFKIVQKKESDSVYNRTFEALKTFCPDGEIFDDHISVLFDKYNLRDILDFFHCNHHSNSSDHNRSNNAYYPMQFLVSRRMYNREYYCTPKKSSKTDTVTNLPFFWCRGEACFCNVLESQTLDNESNWEKYTLYHAAEIIGFPLLEQYNNLHLPKENVNNFAAEIRQAKKMYARLICRGCGHMIFSTRGTNLNGSKHFSCMNSQCDEFRKQVYLSQCNNCKRGLIDSRDSKRCPNNWVICPHCLSCCNDSLFDNLRANYFRNGYVPQKIQDNIGHGHNNKNIFFCPKCGERIQEIKLKFEENKDDDSAQIVEKTIWGCPTCEISYEEQLINYKQSIGKN